MVLGIEPEISSCSVVMLGDFNPAIVHPSWLHATGVESNISEAITDIQVVIREISSFRIDTRTYTVMPDSFTLETSTAPWVTVADITRQIFEELLVHTPIREFGSEMEPDDRSKIGGLQSLTMRRQKRLDAAFLITNAKIEPSVRLSGNRGIFMEVNHHHKLLDYDQGDGARLAVKTLVNSFESRISEADSIINSVKELS
ncbi:MAG: hypothetical protein OXE94_15795 [Aestuariivita sp.]|nr:hypothetical protein [Aestuariivita sp.]MCY4201436.1 hypothetical protein [Aestuariivita sp.]MCY4287948.1 hypothetical protein [Aestuariivita sp.]MCY4346876.1 hypothetical protein [Aestuariivita sp.]